MKKATTYFLLYCIILQSLSQSCIVAAFYLHREYIAKNLCINRFDTVPVCKGQCVLEDRLEKNEKQQQQFPDFKQKEVHLYLHHPNILIIENPADHPLYENIVLSRERKASCGFPCSIFHPPRYV